jgi:DNA-binding response OmpR family regulator
MAILLVEDDSELAADLMEALRKEQFAINHVDNGIDALYVIAEDTPEVVILDLGLPDLDGLDVLARLRGQHPTLPVLLLTARNSLDDKVAGLDSGADDYLAKPFEIPELLARLRALGRRVNAVGSNLITIGAVSIDTASQETHVANEPVELPRKEFMLLRTLMENAGRVQTRKELERKLYNWDEEVASNSLDVHVHQLRKKLGSDFIKTIRGVGYAVKEK